MLSCACSSEEPGGAEIATYPRNIEGLARKKESKRTRQREAKKAREVEMARGRTEELKRLKNLKVQEVQDACALDLQSSCWSAGHGAFDVL